MRITIPQNCIITIKFEKIKVSLTSINLLGHFEVQECNTADKSRMQMCLLWKVNQGKNICTSMCFLSKVNQGKNICTSMHFLSKVNQGKNICTSMCFLSKVNQGKNICTSNHCCNHLHFCFTIMRLFCHPKSIQQ